MDKEKIYNLIDEYRKSLLKIDENFVGQCRIDSHEKEEKFYKPRFKELGVKINIISHIYEMRNNDEGIQTIKNSIDKRLM